ncbi:MAG: glycosyltransferase [Planctomycetota bacterium]|nr:MAG: glycosyltransferase [Planctomycetota bacterium]
MRDVVDEIVIVDTGSTDRTKEIAARFGARVVDFAWVDSFAAARNVALDHATRDWIFWMDADDRLDEANREKLRRVFAGLPEEQAAYSMKCLCLTASGSPTAVDHVRLFRRNPQLRWEHRVHEQILPALRRLGVEVRFAHVVIEHVGYQDPALRQRKQERDLRLLELERAEQPDHPFTLFNLASVFIDQGKLVEAVPLLERSLERSGPADSIVRKLYALLAQCQRRLGQRAEALAACAAGRALYPDDVELLFQEAVVRAEEKDGAGAEQCYLKALANRERAHFGSVLTGLGSYLARSNLARLYFEQGRAAEAEAQWRAALAEESRFGAAEVGLAELYLAQGRWPELDEAIGHLCNGLAMPMEAAVLQARACLARKEFEAARRLLAETIAQYPREVWPRVILSHCLLEQGSDRPAAEQALLDILELDPENAGARHNLQVLRGPSVGVIPAARP